MYDTKSNPENKDKNENDIFHDASDEFPFYESNSHSTSSTSSSIHQNHEISQDFGHRSSNFHSPTGPRLRRRSFSHRFRDEKDSTFGNDPNPTYNLSFEYSPKMDNIKRVDQKLALEDGFGSKIKRVGQKLVLEDGFGSKIKGVDQKLMLENLELDLPGGEFGSNLVSKSVDTEIIDDVAVDLEDPEVNSFVGLDRKKRFGNKLEELNESSDVVLNSVVTGIKDEGAEGSEDFNTNTFTGFDYIGSGERRKRFIEKLEGLVDENDNLKGFGVNLNTEVKDDNFDLPSGEISSSSVTKDDNNNLTGFVYTPSEDKKKRFAKRLKELKARKENRGLQTGQRLDEENRDSVVANCATDDDLVFNESSSGFLFGLADLVIKAISLQLNLLVSLVTFPIKFMYSVYMFVVDPFQIARRGENYLRSRLFQIVGFVSRKFVSFAGEWLKDHKSTWQLVLRFGWGFLWATYVCAVLVCLLISAFVFSGILISKLVDEPIQMKEALIFDYTKNSPVAFVPITSCPVETRDVSFVAKSDVGKSGFPRVIPHNHKLQATVSLMLPESDYNRNLGMFQIRVDLLSANGLALTSSRRSCMLHFKSQPIRMLLTFFKVAPLVTGYLSESQTLNINLRGLTEGVIPTACLRVMIEQRAEFRPGAGIPEIYDASLTFESELPLLKKLMWLWKKTLFIWLGLSVFTMQLFFALVCCRPLLLPRRGVRDGSAGNIAPQDNHPAQR